MKKFAVSCCLLAVCCAHQPQINNVENPVLQVSGKEACAKLTQSIEANVILMKQQMLSAKGVSRPSAEIVRVECRGLVLRASVLISAVVDEEFHQTIVEIGLRLLPDGSIEGDVLGSRKPE